jgi:hypothetical protein
MTAFIIAVLVYFVLSLTLSLISIAYNVSQNGNGGSVAGSAINVLLSVGFITWSIILLVS